MEFLKTMITTAQAAMNNAYSPYSNYNVGACLRTENNQLISGCNVENASYGLTLCAEACAIGAMIASGYKRIKEVVIIVSAEQIAPPCGACRQRLWEFADSNTPVHLCNIYGAHQTFWLSELLPHAFGPKNLE